MDRRLGISKYVLCFFLFMHIQAHAVTLQVCETWGEPGGIVRIPVEIAASGEVAGVHMRMLYDPGRLELLGVSAGSIVSSGQHLEAASPHAGSINFLVRPRGEVTGLKRAQGTLALLFFRIHSHVRPGEVAEISFSDMGWGSLTIPATGISDYSGHPVFHHAMAGRIYVVEQAGIPVSQISNPGLISDILLPMKQVYTDRSHLFLAPIPEQLHGQTYLRMPDDDGNVVNSDYLSFSVLQPVRVYVAVDSRMEMLPSWLSGWSRWQPPLYTDDYADLRSLYYRDYQAGTISLGSNRDNGMPEGFSMYSVIITEQWPNQVSSWMCYE